MMKPLFYLAMTVAVTGFAFINPSVSALISKRSDPNRQGEVLGVNQGCASLARILGPLAGVFAFKADPTRVLPYGIACATLLIVLMLLPMIPETARRAGGVSPFLDAERNGGLTPSARRQEKMIATDCPHQAVGPRGHCSRAAGAHGTAAAQSERSYHLGGQSRF